MNDKLKEIEHECTDEIVCPWCGDEEGESWEYRTDSGEIVCGECGKKFYWERDHSVTYETRKEK